MPSNVLPLHFKQIFPPIIWMFTEVEGDGIESRLPFKIFSTLKIYIISTQLTPTPQLTLLLKSTFLDRWAKGA